MRHPSSLEHDTGPHPECPDRIRAIERVLDDAGWPGLELREPEQVERRRLELVHTHEHIERIERFCESGGGMLDADTIAVPASWEAALRAAGGAAEGAERVLAGESDFAFCAMRPPGHHAESYRPMGFCLFNSIAVGAASAIADAGAERVLILDWDVHHGNGTEEIFAARDDVLFISIHQSPLYPGTGAARDVGTGAGHGFNLNLPVPPGADGELYLALLQHLVVPVAREWKPDLIAISAGYDAHRDDPLANCMLEDADYASMASTMRALGGDLDVPLLVCLEGGYDLGALSRSTLATIRALGEDISVPDVDPGRIAPALERFGSLWPAALGSG